MSFNKGTLATIVHGQKHTVTDEWELKRRKRAITVWRHATAEDAEAWQESKRKAAAEAEARGEDTFSIYMDSAGESRLSPRDVYLDFELGDIVQIVRGRLRGRLGYHSVNNVAEVLLPSGELAFIEKKYLSPIAA
jgi:hypothetical protein